MFKNSENEFEADQNTSSNNPFKAQDDTKIEEEAQKEEDKKEEAEAEQIEEEKEETDDLAQKLQAELDDMNNKYIRLAADFDNYRKRQMQERESLLKYGCSEVLTKILPVLDTFERAKEHLKDVEDVNSVKESYEVAFKQLTDTLAKAGLEKIEATGEVFDPNLHEAIAQTPSKEHEDNTIIATMQAGYKLKDRVLRPALVNVAVSEE